MFEVIDAGFQFTVQNRKDWLFRNVNLGLAPDAVISESILNRLVSGAEIITLEGPNMRLTTNA